MTKSVTASDATTTMTIRVPKSLKDKLEDTSRKKQVNLNLLVNQILTKNMHWDEHVNKMGWLQFNPATVRELFNYLDEKQISDLAKSIKLDIINGVKFIYGDTSLPHLVEFMISWLNSTNIPFRHVEDSKHHKFLINHTLGINWSTFAILVSKEFVMDLGYDIIDLNSGPDSYSYTIVK